MNPQVQAWMAIAAVAIPEVESLVKAVIALRKKYPQAGEG